MKSKIFTWTSIAILLVFNCIFLFSSKNKKNQTLDKLRRKIGKESILLLTDYTRDDVSLFLKSQKVNLDFYEIGNLDIGLNLSAKAPALLLLTSNNTVATSFILNADTKNYINLFYDFVETKFMEK